MQPINYLAQVADPFAQALQGVKFGAGMADLESQRTLLQQERLQKQQEIQQQQQQREMLSKERAQFFSNPNPTMRDAARFASLLSPEQANAFRPYMEGISKEQQKGVLMSTAQVLSALQTSPETGIKLLRERAVAARNSDDPGDADLFDRIADAAENPEQGPAVAFKALAQMAAAIPGAKEMFEAADKAVGTTGDQFKVLGTSEASGLGLPPGAYQQEVNTGKITAIGGGGVTVNMPSQIGTIPQDYKVVYDANRNPVSMEVIPGTKTARDLEAAGGKATQAAESVIKSSSVVLEDLGRLKKSITGQKIVDPVTGVTGAVAAQVPGSARKSAEGLVRTIVANIGFDRLNQMRLESPTGGALGNITEQELKFLQSVLGSIDLDQKDSDIIRNLGRLEKIYGNIMKKAAAYPNAAQHGFGGAVAASANEVIVNGQKYPRPANFTDKQWSEYKKAVGASQ